MTFIFDPQTTTTITTTHSQVNIPTLDKTRRFDFPTHSIEAPHQTIHQHQLIIS